MKDLRLVFGTMNYRRKLGRGFSGTNQDFIECHWRRGFLNVELRTGEAHNVSWPARSCAGVFVSAVLDRYRMYQLKTNDLFGLDPSNLNKKSLKGWTNAFTKCEEIRYTQMPRQQKFCKRPSLRLCDPLIRDKAMLPVLVQNTPWYLEPTPCCLVTATSLAKLPMGRGFQEMTFFHGFHGWNPMSFFKGVFFRV